MQRKGDYGGHETQILETLRDVGGVRHRVLVLVRCDVAVAVGGIVLLAQVLHGGP